MGGHQAPHQAHCPGQRDQVTQQQTYQTYAAAERSESSHRPTRTRPPTGPGHQERTCGDEERRKAPPPPPPQHKARDHRGKGPTTANPPHQTQRPRNEIRAPAAVKTEGRTPPAGSQGREGTDDRESSSSDAKA